MVQKLKSTGLGGHWYLEEKRCPPAFQAEQLEDHRNRSRPAGVCPEGACSPFQGSRPSQGVPSAALDTQPRQRSPGVMWSAQPAPFQLKVTRPCPSPQGQARSAQLQEFGLGGFAFPVSQVRHNLEEEIR